MKFKKGHLYEMSIKDTKTPDSIVLVTEVLDNDDGDWFGSEIFSFKGNILEDWEQDANSFKYSFTVKHLGHKDNFPEYFL